MKYIYSSALVEAGRKMATICCAMVLTMGAVLTGHAQTCSPLSTLSCSQVPVSIPYALDFSANATGLADKNGVATGFTMVDPPSAPLVAPSFPGVPGYEPTLLEVTGGRLQVRTTAGITYLNPAASSKTNSQVNGMGVGMQVTDQAINIQVKVVQPPAGANQSEQAGIWFGLDEDNYVKVGVMSWRNGQNVVEIRREVNAGSADTDRTASAPLTLTGSVVSLRLALDPATSTAEGFYSVDGGAEARIGKLPIPASFLQGRAMNDGSSSGVSFAGIFASHRRATAPLTYTFDDFSITAVAPRVLSFAPTTLSFATEVGSAAAAQSVALAASGGNPTTITLTKDPENNWLVLPTAVKTGTLSFGTNTSGLAAGVYRTAVKASAAGFADATLDVQLTVTDNTAPKALGFAHANQVFDVLQGNTESILNYIFASDNLAISAQLTALDEGDMVPTWLRVNGQRLEGIPYTTGSEISFEVDATNLSIGVYRATITASASGYTAGVVHLQVNVIAEASEPLASIKVNFQDAATPVPAGFLKDFGQPFGPRTDEGQGTGFTYGWRRPSDGAPFDMTTKGRLRKGAMDMTLRTLMHMQFGAEGYWEVEVPNGNYQVSVSVGDPEYFDSRHTINVEGFNVLSDRVATAALPNISGTIVVTVTDGFLTVDASTGTNTKINSVVIQPYTGPRPHVKAVNPTNGAKFVSSNTSISTDILGLPNGGVDNATITTASVRLVDIGRGTAISANVNGTGGGDAITLVPQSPLQASTRYRFEVTEAVKDLNGASFVPFSSTFTTGTEVAGISGIASFDKVALGNTKGQHSTLTMGPDGKLYASTIEGTIKRFGMNADGTLEVPEVLAPIGSGRMIIGLVFDPASTAANPIAWITHSSAVFIDGPEWDGKLTLLSGPNLATVQEVLVNLPRSYKDHLTNSVTFGPDGALYFTQGSNSAMGRADATWGNREEYLLTGSVLRLDVTRLGSLSLPIDVKTPEGGGTYNPFAANAPLTLYATGVRNAYDLVWHSNGQLYVPTNGSAAGGNTPASVPGTRRPEGSSYSGFSVPALTFVNQTMRDYLFRVVKGGYYGHPNPLRGEYVMNGGNPTSSPDQGQVNGYPVGTLPDPNYRGYVFDFQANKSPNGVIEYKSNVFGGALKGKLMVVRYSQNDDIMLLEPGKDFSIVNAIEGISIPGMSGFHDPLDLVEDVRTGNIYVSEYGGEGRITLLRPQDTYRGLVVTPEEIIDNDVVDAQAGINRVITVTNTNSGPVTLSGITLTGIDKAQFVLADLPSFPHQMVSGGKLTFQVAFKAAATGVKTAAVVVASNDARRPAINVNLRGLGTSGLGGSNEPSLQAILNVYGIPVNVGDDNPATNVIHSNTGQQKAPLLGEEVAMPTFQKAEAGPVTIEPLAVFGPTSSTPVVGFGWYEAGSAQALRELFTVANTPLSNGQTVSVNSSGTLSFDPGVSRFGFYSRWPFFDNRHLYSEDNLNTFTGNIPHHVRVYPLKDQAGAAVPNAYIVAFEEHTSGFDYQDIVVIVRNVKASAPIETVNGYKVNFQLASSVTPADYVADTGLPFDEARGFGWIHADTKAPLNLTAFTRERNTTDPIRLRTLIHLQYPNKPNAAWEYKLANGSYQVSLSVGDADLVNSRHSINVEGIPFITEFVPTASQKFMAATKMVRVADGKLTIDPLGGTNTKLNYVIIEAMEDGVDLVPPTVAVNLIGTLQAANTYRNQVEVSIQASDDGGSGLASVTYSLNNGDYQPYTNAFVLQAVGQYTLRVRALDGQGNMTLTQPNTFSVQAVTASKAKMFVENRDRFPANDHLTFSRIQIPHRRTDPVTMYNANHDLVTLRIYNKGLSPLTISNLVLSNPGAWKLESLKGVTYDAATALPLTIASNTSVDLNIRFIAVDQGTRVVVLHDLLTILSNDDTEPEKKIYLHGLWQLRGEGTREPYAQEIIDAFGFKTNVGFKATDPDEGNPSKLKGDEVLSSFFVRVDPSRPVFVRQLAAYHGCCDQSESLWWHAKGTTTRNRIATHIIDDGQTLLPRSSATTNSPAQGSVNPSGIFGFVVKNDWTDRTQHKANIHHAGGLIGVRVWKALDFNGNVIPDAYIIGNDYLGTENTNFDYQDNMYFVTNIRPEEGPAAYSALKTNPSALNFGEKLLNSQNSFTLHLSSLGKIQSDGSRDPAIQISSVKIVGENQSEFSATMPAKTILNVQETTTMVVNFNPASEGFKVADLLIYYNNSQSPYRVPLYGIGLNQGTRVNVHHRINSGSPTSVTVNGKTWRADDQFAYDNLEPYVNPNLREVTATDEDLIYLTEQSSNGDRRGFRYEIPMTNGNYVVRLHFAEIYFGVPGGDIRTGAGAGSRVFTVAFEGQQRLINFDLVGEVGAASAIVRNFPVTVADGKLNINFTASTNRPMVSAVEVYSLSGATAATSASMTLLEDALQYANVQVFPNPVTEQFTVTVPEKFEETVTLTLVDQTGRTIPLGAFDLATTGRRLQVDTRHLRLNRGLYMLKVESPDRLGETVKIIVP